MNQQPFKPPVQALVPDFHSQHAQFPRAFALIAKAIAERAFPGASLAVTLGHRLLAWKSFGRFTYDAESPAVSPTTIYDIASLTKVIATTSMAMLLFDLGKLDLEMPVTQVLPQFGSSTDPRRERVTVRTLLAHSSGLPAYERLFERAASRADLIELALAQPLVSDPGSHAEYSDIGFILLGLLLEHIADETIDLFCERKIFSPLGMSSTSFLPSTILKRTIPPTVNDTSFRMRLVQGEVHDENASVMGGVSGHAGLFASSMDIATFALAMLHDGANIVRPETIHLFTQRERLPDLTSRALGWDTPSEPSQSGHYFSPGSFGHLGYTGTSLWCDPERKLSITFLTNRVWPDCSSQAIKLARPALHDAIIEELGLS